MTIFLTALSLIAFAANSVLCRLALSDPIGITSSSIDAASFTILRLLAGAIMLALMITLKHPSKDTSHANHAKGSWTASLMLFIYAATFSYAYISLDTATGALVLFGSVQISMLVISIFRGNRLAWLEWLGMAASFAGFIYLVLPNVDNTIAPSITGIILMAGSGIAWGVYTLLGRNSKDPLCDTAYNFMRTLPLIALLTAFTFSNSHISLQGAILAILSGALASGLGYSIWYAALKGLSATQSAIVQLAVPVLAAIGGVVFVAESVSLQLIAASSMVLGGILLVVLGKNKT